MKLSFSRAERLDGMFFLNEDGELSGFTQVYVLPISIGSNIATDVQNAGTVIVSRLVGVTPDAGWSGTVTHVNDVTDSDPEAPKKIPVRGRASIEYEDGKKATVNFEGVFHPTTYLREAWVGIQQPDWTPEKWW